MDRVSEERVIPIHVEGPREHPQPTSHHESERQSPRLDLGNASYREYVWEGGEEGSKPRKEKAKFGRRWRESGEKREASNVITTTSVDASTNVVFESSSSSVKRSKKSASDANRGPKEVRDLLEQSVEEAKGTKNNLDNTSYREFVWEGSDHSSGAAVTWI